MMDNICPKILFYTSHSFLFRSTVIGHLYEISQKYPVILLSEKLDEETEKVIRNKKLFPKLEKIVPVEQYTGKKMNFFTKNRHLYKLAKDVIEQYKPDVVMTTNDVYPFEMYLTRFAKQINSTNICLQAGLQVISAKEIALWIDLIRAYSYFSIASLLPFGFRLLLVKIGKRLKHLFYYWILPLMVRQTPFRGKSSFILGNRFSGLRNCDYCIVFSKRDYNLFIKNGVSSEKLYILPHPLTRRETRAFFEKAFFREKLKTANIDKKIITLMLPAENIGFRRKDLSLISEREREEERKKIIFQIVTILKGWKVYIKPHPETKQVDRIKKFFESISGNIKVVDPREPADKYIEMARVIVGLPLSASTTLFTASLQCPQKPILSLDFEKELLGDYYKNFEGIEYIDNEKDFLRILELIRDNKYYKKNYRTKLKADSFSNATELLEHLVQK